MAEEIIEPTHTSVIIIDFFFNFCLGKIPRSPDENDRTELLRQADPVDYTGDTTTDNLEDYINISHHNTTATTSYQQSQPPPRYSSVTRTGHKPPRGIFDDV